MKKQIKVVRNNNFVEKFVLADGIGLSGKILIAYPLASMKRVEKVSMDLLFDTLPRMYEMGKVSHDATVTMLRLEADYRLSQTIISREVNFRPTDESSIFRDPFPLRYILRLFSQEGEPVVERVKEEKPIFLNLTHDGLCRAQIFFDAFDDRLRIVEMIRNPVDIVYDWYVKKFGKRIGTDPREHQLSIEWKGDVVPYMAYGWEDEYLSVEPIDRIIRMVEVCFRTNLEGYNKLDKKNKQRVMFVVFDNFVVDPIPHCKKMAKFIDTEITHRTKIKLKQERCPREINPDKRIEKRKIIDENASKKYKEMLDKLVEEYDTFVKQLIEREP